MIITTTNIGPSLVKTLRELSYDRLFILTDDHTHTCCLPLIAQSLQEAGIGYQPVTIAHGDDNKSLLTLQRIWDALIDGNATRHSLLLCLGGGVVTDIGGFAAASYKRGIRYINIPTTLLAMVDAAAGGKTAINYKGLKNEIGAFHQPLHIFLCSTFLDTLPTQERLSGIAEMIKHLLLRADDGTAFATCEELAEADISPVRMGELITSSVAVKSDIVAADPTEHGLRKALNFGHTIGHAIEELLLSQGTPVPHGYAVAWGMIGELYLSHIREGFPLTAMRQFSRLLHELYGACPITCNHYDALFGLMKHDKKNCADNIRCVLLANIGIPKLDCILQRDEIDEALDFIREAN